MNNLEYWACYEQEESCARYARAQYAMLRATNPEESAQMRGYHKAQAIDLQEQAARNSRLVRIELGIETD